MVYPSEALYLTWGGQIGTTGEGADTWQCGLHLGKKTAPTSVTLPPDTSLPDLWINTLIPFHTDPYVNAAQGAVMKWVKVAHLAPDGTYIEAPIVYEPTTPVPGSQTTPRGAPQLSLAVTLATGQSFGRANYGRFYLPWYCGYASFATGRLGSGDTAGLAAAAKTLINNVNSWAHNYADSSTDVLIFSKEGAGASKVPYKIMVGDVIDTQRRRRNKIGETYAQAVIAS